jgi:hypothetical protein
MQVYSTIGNDDFYGLDFRAESSIFNACACSSDGLERRSPEPKVAGSNPARRTITFPIIYSQNARSKNPEKRPPINACQQLGRARKKQSLCGMSHSDPVI